MTMAVNPALLGFPPSDSETDAQNDAQNGSRNGSRTERVLLGHGSGGQLSATLLRDLIVPSLHGRVLEDGEQRGVPLEDAAVLDVDGHDLVMSTDSYVVSPLFFPGGDIGTLAVHGTVNNIAMMGGDPLAIALSFVIEEGFPLDSLRLIAGSVGQAAREAGVPIVTGDTKVVGRGAADGLFVTTTGIGRRLPNADLSAGHARVGDVVLVSGPIGLHGITVLDARESLGLDCEIASDTQALHHLVRAMVSAGGVGVHALRDPTRGGLSSALNDIARTAWVGVELADAAIPIPAEVGAACERLGLDPMHVASEGCLVAFVAPKSANAVLAAMRRRPEGAAAVRIGTVVEAHPGRVTGQTEAGVRHSVDVFAGAQLSRIC